MDGWTDGWLCGWTDREKKEGLLLGVQIREVTLFLQVWGREACMKQQTMGEFSQATA